HLISAGKNFKPLGYDEADGSNGAYDCAFGPSVQATQFTGNFDGANHVIKNLRLDAFKDLNGKECEYTGMFAKTSGANIARIKFEQVEIEDATNYVGIITGKSFGSKISEINVKEARIRARNSAGWI